jgi:hypothetical protein
MTMMGGRGPQGSDAVGPTVASFPTYEAAQKAVSSLIAADIPLAEPVALDRDVFDHRGAGAVGEEHLAAEHLGHDAHLTAALLEAPHVDEAGGDDLAGGDGGDAADRHEDMAAAGDLHHEPDHAGRIVFSVDDDDVADLAETVAGGVEDRAP